MAFSYGGMNTSQKTNILSRLVERFPFMLRIMNKKKEQIRDPWPGLSSATNAVSSDQTEDSSLENSIPESVESYPEMTQPLSVGDDNVFPVSDDGYDPDQTGVEFFEASSSYASTSILNQDGVPSFSRELLTRQNLGPREKVTEHVKDGINDIEVGSVCNAVNVFNLPIGVKPLRQSNDHPGTSRMKQQSDPRMNDTKNSQSLATVNMLRDGAAKATLGVVADLVKNGVKSENRISDSPSRRQGVLAGRAASMLEAERHSQKQLTRIVKMRYRGGTYRGQIQGGLPEGKGCLTLPDGSVYDGTWRYGKRSGLALFYFNNGDLYQGSWRDDLIHGKGWLYFQSGDRWFANFWKGEANGEGRFYSKDGDIFFGHFKDGWRNGEFLHVSVDGTRFREIWDEGILVSRTELDPDASDTASG
ncbi:hypothetical protein Leryth_001160 [Lithospermum erythrorhizon]|nr:hypothetical protein Leryth_001160 [Lithospermum erythrorhizon]